MINFLLLKSEKEKEEKNFFFSLFNFSRSNFECIECIKFCFRTKVEYAERQKTNIYEFCSSWVLFFLLFCCCCCCQILFSSTKQIKKISCQLCIIKVSVRMFSVSITTKINFQSKIRNPNEIFKRQQNLEMLIYFLFFSMKE